MFSKILAKRKAEREAQARKDFLAEIGMEIADEAAAIQAFNEGRSAGWYRRELELQAKKAEAEKRQDALSKAIQDSARLHRSAMAYSDAVMEAKIKAMEASMLPYTTMKASATQRIVTRMSSGSSISGITEEFVEDYYHEDEDPNERYKAKRAHGMFISHMQELLGAELAKSEPDIIGVVDRIRNAYGELAAEYPDYIKPDRVSDEEMEYLDNEDVVAQRLLRDKAIIAMHLLRINKAPNAKGVGANREDHPVFRDVVNLWFTNSAIHAEELETIESARSRVIKYQRQLMASPYWDEIQDADIPRHEMMAHIHQAYKAKAEKELEEHLKEETYGGW